MIELSRAKNWNLLYTEKEFDDSLISKGAAEAINVILDEYPIISQKFIALLGNLVQGNLLFNYMVERLLQEKKIKNRAIRISNYTTQFDLSEYYGITSDIQLIDNIEFNQNPSQFSSSVIKAIDHFYYKTNIIVFNIGLEEELKFAPKSFNDLLDISLNIMIKKHAHTR